MIILRTLLVTLSTSVQDEDTVTMTMVTVVTVSPLHSPHSYHGWPGTCCRALPSPATAVESSADQAWSLQRCSVTRGAHTRFATICSIYCTALQLQTMAAAWPSLVAGCLAGLFMLPRVTIHNPARHHCPAHRDKHRWRLEASVNGKLTGGSSIELLNRL